MIDRIGGRGTLGGIWCRLKEMKLVVGIKRMHSDISSATTEELESLGSSLAMNRSMDYRMSDLEDFVTTVDSHKSPLICSLRMRMATLGIDSPSDEDTSDSSESDSDSNSNQGSGRAHHRRAEVLWYRDDVRVVVESSGEDADIDSYADGQAEE